MEFFFLFSRDVVRNSRRERGNIWFTVLAVAVSHMLEYYVQTNRPCSSFVIYSNISSLTPGTMFKGLFFPIVSQWAVILFSFIFIFKSKGTCGYWYAAQSVFIAGIRLPENRDECKNKQTGF